MSRPQFSVKIDSEDQIDQRLDYLAKTLVERGKYPILIDVRPETRTAAMNRFLWGWLYRRTAEQLKDAGIVIALDDGSEHPYDSEMIHEIAKRKLLVRAEGMTTDGKVFRRYWSTTELARKSKDVEGTERPSFREYVDGYRALVYQLWKITIPDPPLRVADYADIMDELRR